MTAQLVKPKRLALNFFAAIAITPLLLGGLPGSAKTTAQTTNTKPTTARATNTKSTTALRIGSRGKLVSQLQARLKKQGLYTGPINGVFGRQTHSAVLAFQRAKGLRADGVVGSKTLAAMGL